MTTAKDREKNYRGRFKGFQAVDAERESLIEELIEELNTVTNKLDVVIEERDKLVSTLKADLESEKDSRREKQEVVRVLREKVVLMEQARFVLVLIDADADIYLFHKKYLKRGLLGGQEAADEFMSKIKKYLLSLGSIKSASDVQIVVKAYANLSGLAQACVRDGKLGNVADMSQFWVGFSRRYPQVDFVDVGSGKEEADNKIREVLRLHFANEQCKHILLACCHDAGYVPVLRQYAAQPSALGRLTLLSGGKPVRSDIMSLGFPSANIFESMFSSRESRKTSPSPNTSSKKATTFASVASQPVASSTISVSDIKALMANTRNPKSPSPKPDENPVKHSSRLRPVRRNRSGKRVDKPLHADEKNLQALRKGDLCHWHYLRADCKSAATACGYNHNYPRPLSPKEYDALWILSRQNPCRKAKKDGVCEDDQCIFGHASA